MHIRSKARNALLLLLTCSSCLGAAIADDEHHVELGRTSTGASVEFTGMQTGWGIHIRGTGLPDVSQSQPARIEISDGVGHLQEFKSAYSRVRRTADGVDATAAVPGGSNVTFEIHDRWQLRANVLSVSRTVTVRGTTSGGFSSSIVLSAASLHWDDASYLAPGVLYADPTYDGERSPGGTLNYAAHNLSMREDILPAPLFGLYFKDGFSIAMLDPTPRGETTVAESKLTEAEMTDERFQLGSFNAWQAEGSALQFGFHYPASVRGYFAGHGDTPTWIRRFHPIQPGFTDSYRVSFRIGHEPGFREFSRDAWRWSWEALKPPIDEIDIPMVRRVLADHLAAQVTEINGHTGVPFVLSTMDDSHNWNWTMVAMGFVGKDLDCADALLLEADRDSSPRGQHMRALGLAMIDTMIRALPTVPLPATGIDLTTGQPWDHIWLSPWLRNATEDMRVLMLAYRREKKRERDHPEWIA